MVRLLAGKGDERPRRAPDRCAGAALREAGRTRSELNGVDAVRFDRIDVVDAVSALGVVGEQILGLRPVGAEGVPPEDLVVDRRAASGTPDGFPGRRLCDAALDRRIGAGTAENE